jgi:hypothetical protein
MVTCIIMIRMWITRRHLALLLLVLLPNSGHWNGEVISKNGKETEEMRMSGEVDVLIVSIPYFLAVL